MKPRYAIKFLPESRQARYGRFTYPEPGAWTTRRKPNLCRSGFHAVRTAGGRSISGMDIAPYYGDTAWLVEVRYGIRYGDSKICAGQMRLIRPLISKRGSLSWTDSELHRVLALARQESAMRGGVLL